MLNKEHTANALNGIEEWTISRDLRAEHGGTKNLIASINLWCPWLDEMGREAVAFHMDELMSRLLKMLQNMDKRQTKPPE